MQKIKDDLDELYATIEASKKDLAYNKGMLEPKMKRLKDEFEIRSLEEAEKRVEDLEAEKGKLKLKIEKLNEEIRKELENGRQ